MSAGVGRGVLAVMFVSVLDRGTMGVRVVLRRTDLLSFGMWSNWKRFGLGVHVLVLFGVSLFVGYLATGFRS